MIQEQLAFLPEFLPDYRPFPPAKERTAWQGLPLRAKQRFLQAVVPRRHWSRLLIIR